MNGDAARLGVWSRLSFPDISKDTPCRKRLKSDRRFSDEELQDLVASTDSGGREPTNRKVALLIASVAFLWSAFQVWIADLQFQFAQYIPGARVIGSDQTRPMHLAFALFLAFLAYPAFKKIAAQAHSDP